ncbi:MAG: chemotaxis protein CheW [Gammaproteobacteria bacterium]|jgi:chemotaxis signal transduction protein
MSTSEAWLLDCGNSLAIAVGDHEMAEYVQERSFHRVPGSPGYCSSVLVWQNNIVPVMDLSALQYGPAGELENFFVCVLNYQEAPNSPIQHLALRVVRAPQKIRVDDEHACEIPDSLQSSVLKQVCLACFNHDELPVLVLDIARLCSAEFRTLANAA